MPSSSAICLAAFNVRTGVGGISCILNLGKKRIQQLRQYDRRIFDLDTEIVRKLSKLDGVMQRCNIRLSNYVSNTDSVSYKEVVRAFSEGPLPNLCPAEYQVRIKAIKNRSGDWGIQDRFANIS